MPASPTERLMGTPTCSPVACLPACRGSWGEPYRGDRWRVRDGVIGSGGYERIDAHTTTCANELLHERAPTSFELGAGSRDQLGRSAPCQLTGRMTPGAAKPL